MCHEQSPVVGAGGLLLCTEGWCWWLTCGLEDKDVAVCCLAACC